MAMTPEMAAYRAADDVYRQCDDSDAAYEAAFQAALAAGASPTKALNVAESAARGEKDEGELPYAGDGVFAAND